MDESWGYYTKWNKPLVKDKYCMISHIWGGWCSQIHGDRKNVGYSGLGEEGVGSSCLMDIEFQFEKMKEILEMDGCDDSHYRHT